MFDQRATLAVKFMIGFRQYRRLLLYTLKDCDVLLSEFWFLEPSYAVL